MGRGAQNGGRGAARNNNISNTYGNKRGGGNSTSKLYVSALDLAMVSPLGGGTGLGALNAIHSTVGLGRLGRLPQQTQLQSLLEACSEEELTLRVESRMSWLGFVHSWEAHTHIRSL